MAFRGLIVFLSTLLISSVLVQSASLKELKPSDFEVGSLGPDDKLLFIIYQELFPVPGIEHVDAGVRSDHVTLTYITATEHGNHPDARSALLEGGPGTGTAIIRMTPGPSLGFNYTINMYGYEPPLPEGVTRNTERVEITKFID